MPRYRFDMFDGGTHTDLDGDDLPDLETARHAAVRIAADYLKGNCDRLLAQGVFRIEVRDEKNAVCGLVTVTTTKSSDTVSPAPSGSTRNEF